MGMVEAQKLYKDLETGNLAPLYVLFGEEPYLLQQCELRFRLQAVSPETFDFNFNQYYASDCDVSQVRDTVELLPMMAPKRLVILKEAQDLTDKEWAEFESVIETPVDSTVFVILARRLDKRKKQVRLLLDKGQCVEFKKPFENQIPGWIRYIAGTLELEITDEATQLLHKLVGNHLIEIEAELKKLGDYVLPRRRIEMVDVAAAVSRRREESIFELTKAIGQNDRVRALEHLVHLLDQGQNEIGIVSMTARHVRILLAIRKGQEGGLYGAKLAAFAQIAPYFLDEYLGQARLWSPRRLEQTLVVLAETEKALKSSPLSSHIWLENMILKMCGPEAPAARA